MNMRTMQEIMALARQLEPHEGADLAVILQASLPPPEPEIDRLWGEEAIRRLEAHRRGELAAVPMEAIFDKR